MKKNKIYILVVLALMLGFVSCEKEDLAPSPVAAYELYWQYLDQSTLKIVDKKIDFKPGTDTLIVYRNEQLVFKNVGQGTHFAIWTGDSGANRDVYVNSGVNFPLSSSGTNVLKKYTTNGKYKMWVVAKSSSDWGATVETNEVSANVRVIDKPL